MQPETGLGAEKNKEKNKSNKLEYWIRVGKFEGSEQKSYSLEQELPSSDSFFFV